MGESLRWLASGGLLVLCLLLGAACADQPGVNATAITGGGDPQRGRQAFAKYGCITCHTIPGVPSANALVGPPLTKMGARMYIAGRLPNTPENLIQWIRHPQQVEPGNAMPDMNVTDGDGRDMAAYLYTLR